MYLIDSLIKNIKNYILSECKGAINNLLLRCHHNFNMWSYSVIQNEDFKVNDDDNMDFSTLILISPVPAC